VPRGPAEMTTSEGAGQKRGGSYAIHAEIGSGGMATVHLGRFASARGFARTVAIKVLHASYAKNKEFVARFVDEARLVARIHHPNVMPTLDVIAEGEDLRIVMEYVAGESLDQLEATVRANGGRVPVRIACNIIAGVLHGLHAAHEAKNEFGEPLGIVHLDVSPQNILVGTDGTTRVLDFGVARARGERADPGVTGKSAYLAPEQVRGGEVTPRTDVFAASVVLWEMLTGESLFAADNHAATMQRVLGCVIPAVSDKVPELPARLDEVLKVGLRRDPAQRFATARDMALELEQAVVPALASEVGTWVQTVAEGTLVARAAKVQEMEASSVERPDAVVKTGALPGLVSPRALYAEEAAINLPQDVLEDAQTGSLMHLPKGSAGLVPRRAKDGSVRWNPSSAPPAARAAKGPVTPKVRRPVAADPPSPRNRKTLWIGLGGSVVAVLVFLVGARAFALPGYVRGVVIDLAAAHGVTLTVSDASLSDDGVMLRGLTAKLASVPQVTCTIASADVRLAWSAPNHVKLGKTEVALDGDAATTMAAFEAWASGARAKGGPDHVVGAQIEVPTAHLVWTHPGGPEVDVTRIEATGVSGALGSATSVSILDDAHFLTNALVLETRVGTFGPWNLDVDQTLKQTRARLAFDAAVPDGANALLVDDAAGDASLDVAIPRMPTANLGIPRTALGPDGTLPQQTELLLHYGRSGRAEAKAMLRASFFGLHVPELGTRVDARVAGEAAGPAGGAMTVKNGGFSVGPVRGTVTGTVTPARRSVATSLAWKAEAMPCASLLALPSAGAAALDVTRQLAGGDPSDLGDLARDFGALGQAVGALKVTGTFLANGTIAVDTADLAHAKVSTVTKNACGIALFQGK
jgi:hypothetical protein